MKWDAKSPIFFSCRHIRIMIWLSRTYLNPEVSRTILKLGWSKSNETARLFLSYRSHPSTNLYSSPPPLSITASVPIADIHATDTKKKTMNDSTLPLPWLVCHHAATTWCSSSAWSGLPSKKVVPIPWYHGLENMQETEQRFSAWLKEKEMVSRYVTKEQEKEKKSQRCQKLKEETFAWYGLQQMAYGKKTWYWSVKLNNRNVDLVVSVSREFFSSNVEF